MEVNKAMKIFNEVNSERMLKTWNQLKKFPGGKFLFSKIVGRMVPYSGSIKPRVIELGTGHATIEMNDRKKVRNHLNSVHAIALINLGEITAGLAMFCGVPKDSRGILTGIQMSYFKKGRGTLRSTCSFTPPHESIRKEYEVESVIHNTDGELIAKATTRWMIGPRKN